MKISQINSVNYAPNMQSKVNKKPSFGMNYSPEVMTLFRTHKKAFDIPTLRKMLELHNRVDGFVLKRITKCEKNAEGFSGLVVLSKNGHTFADKIRTANADPTMPEIISSVMDYFLDVPIVMAFYNKRVAMAESAKALTDAK